MESLFEEGNNCIHGKDIIDDCAQCEAYCAVNIKKDKTSEQRKAEPIHSGVLRYFPDAIAAVSRVSKAGNDKHNPGQPLHWARGKSNDHLDCVARHIMTPDEIDPDSGEYHLAHATWRALAALQLLEEAKQGKKND